MSLRSNYIKIFGCLAWLVIFQSCNNDPKSKTESPNLPEAVVNTVQVPVVINYDIISEYPHDPNAFTEGLEFKDGYLYESTGQYGMSDIRKVELKTGKVVSSTKMAAKYFGEGMTLMNDKIYQLTYREGAGFIYSQKDLKLVGTFGFASPEGWGMTNNGTSLIYDDGGSVLHFIDPATYKEVKSLNVFDEHGPVNYINELELIHGFIYANQWQTDYILKIDTTTGRVVGRADLGNLRQRIGVRQPSGNPNGPDVLNGIAWDATNNKIYITGKNWPKLVEIKLDN